MNGLSYEQLLAYIQGLYDEGGLSDEDYNRIILYILANGNLETSPRDLMQIRRGLEENLPTLAQGEPGFTLDTEKFFIGGSTGNVKIGEPNFTDVTSLGLKKDGVTNNIELFRKILMEERNLYFPEGEYLIQSDNEDSHMVNIKEVKDLVINSHPKAKLKIQRQHENQHFAIFEECENLSLNDLNIEFSDTFERRRRVLDFYGCKHISVRNSFLNGGVKFDVLQKNSSYLLCENVSVEGCAVIKPEYGISMRHVKGFHILNNYIHDARNPLEGQGIGTSPDAIKIMSLEEILQFDKEGLNRGVISGNYVKSRYTTLGQPNTDEVDACLDIYNGGRDLIITNNVFEGGLEGIEYKTASLTIHDHQGKVIISNNLFIGQGQKGIRAALTDQNPKVDTIISNNIIQKFKGIEALDIRGKNFNVSDIIITSDNVGDYETGVSIRQGENIQLNNIQVYGSKMEAVKIISSRNVRLSNTTLQDKGVGYEWGNAGIYLFYSHNIFIDGVTCQNKHTEGFEHLIVLRNHRHNPNHMSNYHISNCHCDFIQPFKIVTHNEDDAVRSDGIDWLMSNLRESNNTWNERKLFGKTVLDGESQKIFRLYLKENKNHFIKVELKVSGEKYGYVQHIVQVKWDGENYLIQEHYPVTNTTNDDVQCFFGGDGFLQFNLDTSDNVYVEYKILDM